MLENKIIIFMVEGPSDEDVLITPLENKLFSKQVRVRTKVLYTDILTKYSDNGKFETTTSNVVSSIKEIVEEFFKKLKNIGVKYKDIGKIVYITDTDNCFLREAVHSKNKRNCLKILFSIETLFLGKKNGGKEIPFDVIFMSQNLEHVIKGELREYTDIEKKEISKEFSEKCYEDFSLYVELFKDEEVKKWDSYDESYSGIESTEERASNMNCLLEELKIY